METLLRKIPIFRLNFEDDFIERYKSGCEDIFASDSLTNGQYARIFEDKFSEFQGLKYSLAVGSGTDALEIAFRALNVAGKQVIIPTNTFIATAIAVERAGAEVVLADIEDETFSLSPDDLARKLNSNTAAVVVVHIGGIISKYMGQIKALCEQAGVPLVEDAAHAQGASRGDWHAGSIGDIGCFSFFPTKVMTTGEGGMITTQDEKTYELMKSIRNFGRDLNDELICINVGANFKITEFQALLGVLEMDRVGRRMQERTQIALEYQRLLSDSDAFQPVTVENDVINSYYKQIVRTKLSQADLRAFCKQNGVSLTGEVYRYPVHMQPVYRSKYNSDDYPVANAFATGHICPPVYPELDLDEAHYVADVLKEAESAIQSR